MSEERNFQDPYKEATEIVWRVKAVLDRMSDAQWTLGQKGPAERLENLSNRLDNAEKLFKESNDLSFAAYMKSVNQGSENMLNATLAACRVAAENKTVEPISDKHPVDLIINDLDDRAGIGDIWDEIDTNVKMEIRTKWAKFIDDEIVRFIDKRDSIGE